MKKSVLVTGGAGYIGSHTTLALLEADFDVTVIDNLCNSSKESLRRVSLICGRSPKFIEGDIRDKALLNQIFTDCNFDTVIHFAGLKSVSESAQLPLEYYENNVGGTISLCQAMAQANVFNLVFSSSATVYGSPDSMPVREDSPLGSPTNPYGQSKLIAEQILRDLALSDPRWSIALLRYFNPVGAHNSGVIGESPTGLPNNLLPYISQVGVGKLKELLIFGNDYPTHDGTGVRDYIHVTDLAAGHIKAADYISKNNGVFTWNLGTGTGYSVLDVIKTFESIAGLNIPHRFVARRSGDIASCWADPSKAAIELGWRANLTIHEMMRDAWNWQTANPNGYVSPTQT